MKTKKIFFTLVITAIFSVIIMSCKKDTSAATGVPAGQNQLKLLLTDGPSLIFDSIFIDIKQVEIKVVKTDGTEQ
jgi:hypothetical protein